MIGPLAFLLAAAVVAVVVLIALLGWGGQLSLRRRLCLALIGAGIVWAGPARFLGHPAGMGDLMLLAGLLGLLVDLHGPSLWKKANGLDGRIDGRVDLQRAFGAAASRPSARRAEPRPR